MIIIEEKEQLTKTVEVQQQPATETFIDKPNTTNFKEMLLLGNEIKHSYSNIENELKPSLQQQQQHTDYKPVMKKRVYHLNGAYAKPDEPKEEQSTLLLTTSRIEPKTDETKKETDEAKEKAVEIKEEAVEIKEEAVEAKEEKSY